MEGNPSRCVIEREAHGPQISRSKKKLELIFSCKVQLLVLGGWLLIYPTGYIQVLYFYNAQLA